MARRIEVFGLRGAIISYLRWFCIWMSLTLFLRLQSAYASVSAFDPTTVPTDPFQQVSGPPPANEVRTKQSHRKISKQAREAQLRRDFLSPDFLSWVHTNAAWESPDQFQVQAFEMLQPSDAPILWSMFDGANLTNRARISAGLAWLQWTNAVPRLVQEVTAGRKNGNLKTEESTALLDMIDHLGFHAASSEDAWQFLLKAADPGFWRTKIRWTKGGVRTGFDYSVYLCCRRSITAIGLSGRPEAIAVILRLASGEPEFIRPYAANIVEAAMYRDLSQQFGVGFNRKFLPGVGMRSEVSRWNAGSDGVKWVGWFSQVKRGVVAPIPNWHTATNAP